MSHIRPAIVMMVLFTLLTGLGYPLAMTGIAQVLFPARANGSLIVRDGKIVGSDLIGQNFSDAKYLQPRPSATNAPDPEDSSKTVDAPYNAANSMGSNLGPTSAKLAERLKGDAAKLRGEDTIQGLIPGDAVTTSASGLDPHISPAYALAQVKRIAQARKLSEDKVRQLIADHVEGRDLGLLGEPRVNVLRVNLALDRLT